MVLSLVKPKKALNKAFLKQRPLRNEIELFKKNLINLLSKVDEIEREENQKNHIRDFLLNTWYQSFNEVNTKGDIDLAIHQGNSKNDKVGVIIETKRPGNKSEMISGDRPNVKAFHELLLYFMRERVDENNIDLKYCIITNIWEWYIIEASFFEKYFYRNKAFVKHYEEWRDGKKVTKDTNLFYNEIAKPFVSALQVEMPCVFFDIRDYEIPLRNDDKKDDSLLIVLLKLLSPQHLLRLPFINDSNTLDKSFYTELLHIIGLIESKSGSKKIIGRKKEGQRDPGSLIENTLMQLDARDKISRLPKPSLFGETQTERLFNVSLELVITWLNRVLFLKLLEAQLIHYHKGDLNFSFLNSSMVDGFDDLDNLFFRVLARKPGERDPEMAAMFNKIPYLNSSLFEPTELEQITIFISNLQDHTQLPIISSTVLKDNKGKKRTGKLSGLQYLFDFLDAYDFAGEGSEEIQEENKTLINASVLGLIFEKLNGYKDGSFFTPGFITMYMCKGTIRKAVVQKFNDIKGWNCETLDQLYDKMDDRQEANVIFNKLRICDPAVGSGHFLVSALNEIIAIKSELKILTDREGRRLKEYYVEVANDELVITDEDGDLFEYIPGNNESQRIQEALFHEKQTIIENCLFGVDINPNSVKICRLRLWIELLKSAYYEAESNFTELETLPNIDINIKCGNSLISRYALDADIKQALKKSKWSIDSYRLAVMSYRNARNKEEKRTMERLIDSIKSDFETEVATNDKRLVQLKKLSGDLFNLTQQTSLFERSKKEIADWNKQVNELTGKIKKLETELEEIKSNKIFENAFEWRFEFPEVLNDYGDFIGFDVVIGNPPYLNSKGETFNDNFKQFAITNYNTAKYQIDTYILFIEKSLALISASGDLTLIVPNAWLNNLFLKDVREYFLTRMAIMEICNLPTVVFEEAYVDTIILYGKTVRFIEGTVVKTCINKHFLIQNCYSQRDFLNNENYNINIFINAEADHLLRKIEQDSIKLKDFTSIARGVGVYHKRVGHTKEIIASDPYQSNVKKDDTFVPYLRGKNIKPFYIDWQGDCFISYGKWLAEPREPKYFEGSRILMRQIPTNRLIVAYIEDQFITDQSVFIARFENSNISPRVVLGILGSSLMAYYFKAKHSEYDFLFPKVKLQHFKNFPIKPMNPDLQRELDEIVDQIINIKKLKFHSQSTELEAEIDQLVYKLYGLTEEEIKIVEGK